MVSTRTLAREHSSTLALRSTASAKVVYRALGRAVASPFPSQLVGDTRFIKIGTPYIMAAARSRAVGRHSISQNGEKHVEHRELTQAASCFGQRRRLRKRQRAESGLWNPSESHTRADGVERVKGLMVCWPS